MKKAISILLVFVVLLGVLCCGCSKGNGEVTDTQTTNAGLNISKGDLNASLSNGFWRNPDGAGTNGILADSFLFKPIDNKYFDGIVIEQTNGDCGDMPYAIDGDGTIKIYGPYGEDKYVEMFICKFAKDDSGKEYLAVTDCFSALGDDEADTAKFYNVNYGKDNEIVTKLIFERWTDYNYPIQKKGENFDLRQKSIVEKAQQDVTFIGFLSYSEGQTNMFVSAYKKSLNYKAEHFGATYSIDVANRSVKISGTDKDGIYVFNEDYTQLCNEENGYTLYRFTDFAGGVTSQTDYNDIELVSFEAYEAEMESLMAKAS